MPNAKTAKPQSSDILNEMFGTFCLKVFDAKQAAKNKDAERDFKAVHKSLSNHIKASLERDDIFSFFESSKEIIYLMAAMADEAFLNTEWSGRKYWEDNMLEQLYFGTQIAGDKIFERISALFTEKDPLSAEKAGIYLRALCLGFAGRYRGIEDGEAEIKDNKKRLSEFIEKADPSVFLVGNRLFPKEYSYTIPARSRKFLPDPSIISYVCAFFIFMF
ncbi:MAG: DotU family type IV/VI secretion system protein, partial [Holosporaceae bacterium]|nr:DotU family type IV/VI secretion system protein [Holosporaceae bacterium]